MNQDECKHKNYEVWVSYTAEKVKSSTVHFCVDCSAKFLIRSHEGAFHLTPFRTWEKEKDA